MTAVESANWQLPVGQLTLRVFDEGHGDYWASTWTDTTPDQWVAAGIDRSGDLTLSFQVVYLDTPNGRLLIDTGCGEDTPYLRDFLARFAVARTGDVMADLQAIGAAPESVRLVVISHAHGDHLFGATIVRDGQHRPAFPNAKYYLGAADWTEHRAAQPADSPVRSILDGLQAAGQLEMVTGELEIAPGVTLMPTPGETPGHLCVRFSSNGATAYYLGDLIHHVAEVSHPEWIPRGRDAAPLIASREHIYAAALAADATLIASHVRGAGKLERTPSGYRWRSIDID